jgi:REP element-mobilizing transposase RayT
MADKHAEVSLDFANDRIIRERHHRLPRQFYRGFTQAVFTVCAKAGTETLASPAVFDALHAWLLESCEAHSAKLLALTVMPDHLHAMLMGESEQADTWAAMTLFKQKCGFHGARRFPGLQFQKDFYDHMIRNDEDAGAHLRYIVANPLRAGLVTEWDQYPYTFVPKDIEFR